MAELRDGVRQALANLEIADFRYGHELRYEIKPHVNIVTDELHCLTDALEKAEAERDALRATIDGARHGLVTHCDLSTKHPTWSVMDDYASVNMALANKRVAIVPLED